MTPLVPQLTSLMPGPGVAARLNELTLERNIPVVATLELTRRCPLSCAHCYLPETRGRSRARPGWELSAPRWKSILGQLAEAGTMYLVLTGGEPLLRPDLPELCRHAKELNFDVRVYSSGLGLDRSLAASMKEAGVSAFELSVYGRPGTHDRITGRPGSFSAALAAAKLLRKNGIAVKLKTPLLKLNYGDIGWLLRLARTEGCAVSFDPVLSPGNDGDKSNLALRLGKKELSSVLESFPSLLPLPSSLIPDPLSFDFICGAGRNVAAVDPYGNISPCLQFPVGLGNALKTPFSRIWRSSPWLRKWRKLKTADLAECRACGLREACSLCPGISMLEKGDPLVPNGPACRIARAVGRAAARTA